MVDIAQRPIPVAIDNCSYSNFAELKTTHLDLVWDVDWNTRIIRGSVLHTLKAQKSGALQAIFDTSYLKINEITNQGQRLEYKLDDRHDVLGQKLTVSFEKPLAEGEVVRVLIAYETTKACTALGWLEAHQTGSGKFPFFFSQNQAIHCRALLPCQDSPSVKATYTATVTSPLPILMSGLRLEPAPEEKVVLHPIDSGKKVTFKFTQKVPIPSYLIAIAGGEVEFASLGPRTGVWIEPGKLKSAIWEFSRDTENYVKAAEEFTSPYEWGRYDMLVLPSSFPYGGMENSNLTFLTPALITGDRTEVGTIAHECVHSWFGNLIGCANWDSFWLNEGWTTYTERLIARKFDGEAARGFEYYTGALKLKEELQRHKTAGREKYMRLHIPYKFGEDPDEAYGSIPYDKGSEFLLYLERTVGGLDNWIPYMKAYVDRFKGLSITTDDWLAHFKDYWVHFPEQWKALQAVDFEAWLHGESLENPVGLTYDTTLVAEATDLAKKWQSATDFSSFSAKDIEHFASTQTQLMLDTLVELSGFTKEGVNAMEAAYKLDESGNPEIKLRWYLVALPTGLKTQEASEWVKTAGRLKYCRPIYRALQKADAELAKKTYYESGQYFLHPIARRLVAQDLGFPVPENN